MGKLTVSTGDQIRLTKISDGWVAAFHGKDGGMVGRIPTATSTFETPEKALDDLRQRLGLSEA